MRNDVGAQSIGWQAAAARATLALLQMPAADHYATLGLHRRCTEEQIRAAYRLLAKQFHPDVNGGAADAVARTQALNAAHETLSDPVRRRAYDRELAAAETAAVPSRGGRIERSLAQDVLLTFEEFLRGTTLDVRVNDPANPAGAEAYELAVPPVDAPGARFRIPRAGAFLGGFVNVRVKARPDFRFKPQGSDLRCELRISSQRAEQGGEVTVRGLTGIVRVKIPRGVGRGEILRIPGEGLPAPHGGRGDLLVRVQYRPVVTIKRAGN